MNQVVHIIPNFIYFEPFVRGKWVLTADSYSPHETAGNAAKPPKKVLPLSKSSSLKGFSRTSSSFG